MATDPAAPAADTTTHAIDNRRHTDADGGSVTVSTAMNWVRSIRGRSSATFHECRDCGTTLDGPTSACPVCDSTEIASYEL